MQFLFIHATDFKFSTLLLLENTWNDLNGNQRKIKDFLAIVPCTIMTWNDFSLRIVGQNASNLQAKKREKIAEIATKKCEQMWANHVFGRNMTKYPNWVYYALKKIWKSIDITFKMPYNDYATFLFF